MSATLHRSTLAIVLALTLAGFGLRLFQINEVAIRGDEVFTIRYWMRQPLAETLDAIATTDPQPPLAIGLYRAWALLVGPGDQTARFLPALANVIGIPLLYALGKRIAGTKVGLLAALLWALHPFQIWHAQDARNYAIWATANTLAVWLGLRALRYRRRLDWALYVVASAAAAYIYYLEAFTLVALNLYVLIAYRRNRRLLLAWAASQAAIAVALAPWYLQPRLLSGGGYGGTTGGFQPGLLVTWFLPALSFGGRSLPPEYAAAIGPVLLLVFVAGVVVLWRQAASKGLLLALLGGLPLLLLAIVSLRLNVFTPRYVLSVASALVILASALVVAQWTGRHVAGRAFSIVVLGGWLAVTGYSLRNYYFVSDYAKSPDWPALIAYLEATARPEDMIIQAAADEAFNYYFEQSALSNDRKQLPANPRQPAEEIAMLLEQDAQTHPRIWLVAQTFPDWPSAGIVERWLSTHLQQIRATSVSGLRVEEYRPWQPAADAPTGTPLATFGDLAELTGASIDTAMGDQHAALVVLYWRPLRDSETPLKFSVQLIGATNPATGTPLWSQDDQFPQDGRLSTTTWTAGETFRDVYTLPLAGVPPGEYTVVVRLYNPDTGERIPAGEMDGATAGTLIIP